jgi:hypothetical protein
VNDFVFPMVRNKVLVSFSRFNTSDLLVQARDGTSGVFCRFRGFRDC